MARSSQAKRAGQAALFGTASALVFASLFIPNAEDATGILYSFATFGTGYVARPLGGIVFGHIGDLGGRKKSLIIILSIMGIATVSIGLLLSHPDIGVTAAVLLVVLRLIQGLAVGGEWGGAVPIASEHSSKKNRVVSGAWAQQGAPAGKLMASGVYLLLVWLPDVQFMSWEWRSPFMISLFLFIIGLIIRAKFEEPPEFLAVLKDEKEQKVPLRGRAHRSPPVALGMLRGLRRELLRSILQGPRFRLRHHRSEDRPAELPPRAIYHVAFIGMISPLWIFHPTDAGRHHLNSDAPRTEVAA